MVPCSKPFAPKAVCGINMFIGFKRFASVSRCVTLVAFDVRSMSGSIDVRSMSEKNFLGAFVFVFGREPTAAGSGAAGRFRRLCLVSFSRLATICVVRAIPASTHATRPRFRAASPRAQRAAESVPPCSWPERVAPRTLPGGRWRVGTCAHPSAGSGRRRDGHVSRRPAGEG